MADKTPAKEYTEVSGSAGSRCIGRKKSFSRPPQKFVEQANMKDKNVRERFGPKNFPNRHKEYADMAELVRAVSHGPRHEQSALLEMVCGRKNQRELQLHSIATSRKIATRRRSSSSANPKMRHRSR